MTSGQGGLFQRDLQAQLRWILLTLSIGLDQVICVMGYPGRAKKTPDLEKMTFGAGFENVDFLSKFGTEMVGKWQSVRKNVPISAF